MQARTRCCFPSGAATRSCARCVPTACQPGRLRQRRPQVPRSDASQPPASAVQRANREPPPPPSARPERLRPRLFHLRAKDPRKRWGSAHEMAAALRALRPGLADDRSSSRSRPHVVQAARRGLRRRRVRPTWAAAAVGLGLVVATGAYFVARATEARRIQTEMSPAVAESPPAPTPALPLRPEPSAAPPAVSAAPPASATASAASVPAKPKPTARPSPADNPTMKRPKLKPWPARRMPSSGLEDSDPEYLF